MMRSFLLWFIGSLFLFRSVTADEGAWNRFRGPNGSGVSQAKTVPVRWTQDDYNWRIELPGHGHSSPVVWGDRIFLTCCDPSTALRTLLCVDAPTGDTLWKLDEPSTTYSQHRDNSYATATPTVDSDGVVVTWSTPEAVMLLAVDLQGRELWRRNLGPLVSLQGSGSSPILHQDLVVLINDQEDMERSPGASRKVRTRRAGVLSLLWTERPVQPAGSRKPRPTWRATQLHVPTRPTVVAPS